MHKFTSAFLKKGSGQTLWTSEGQHCSKAGSKAKEKAGYRQPSAALQVIAQLHHITKEAAEELAHGRYKQIMCTSASVTSLDIPLLGMGLEGTVVTVGWLDLMILEVFLKP